MVCRSFRTFALAAAAPALFAAPLPAGAATFTTIYNFTGGSDSLQPGGDLFIDKGKLYGAALGTFAMAHFTCQGSGCGTAFAYDLSSGQLKTLHTFAENSNGYFPQTGLVSDGKRLYGVAFTGIYSYGAMFGIDPSGGAEKTVYTMTPGDASVAWYPPVVYKGALYGTSSSGTSNNGNVYRIDPASGKRTVVYAFKGWNDGLRDGWYPMETPLFANGKMYGTTVYGGADNDGAIFEVDPGSGAEKVVYSFTGGADGKWPSGAFVADKGMIYGTIGNGGKGFGALYKFDPATSRLTVLHAFNGGSEGIGPGPLALNAGKFYVSSDEGGAGGWGTIVEIDEHTGKTSVVHSFQGEGDGIWPGTLTVSNGAIYGLTNAEYPFVYQGTLFRIAP